MKTFTFATVTGCPFARSIAAQTITANQQDRAVDRKATLVVQSDERFDDSYQGPNSLHPRQTKETVDVTAYSHGAF